MNPATVAAGVEVLKILADFFRSRAGRRAKRSDRHAKPPEQMTLSMGEQLLGDNPQAEQAEKERNGK